MAKAWLYRDTSGGGGLALSVNRQASQIDEALAAADLADVRSRNYRKAVAIAEELLTRDPMNAETRTHLGDSYSQLGEPYEEIAAEANLALGVRRQRWHDARLWNERSRQVWLDLRRRSALVPRKEGELERMVRAMENCDAALAGL